MTAAPATAAIRPARIADAAAIAGVQVESWQSTYAGLLPDDFLARMSCKTQSRQWYRDLAGPRRRMGTVYVAQDRVDGVIGFGSCGREPTGDLQFGGEVYTL
jgi:hypothetical protein